MSDRDDSWGNYHSKAPGRAVINRDKHPIEDHGYAIDDDIPVPAKRYSSPLRRAVDSLQPGQSFVFFGVMERQAARRAIDCNKRLDKTKEFTIRKQDSTKQGEFFYRVWRIK